MNGRIGAGIGFAAGALGSLVTAALLWPRDKPATETPGVRDFLQGVLDRDADAAYQNASESYRSANPLEEMRAALSVPPPGTAWREFISTIPLPSGRKLHFYHIHDGKDTGFLPLFSDAQGKFDGYADLQ